MNKARQQRVFWEDKSRIVKDIVLVALGVFGLFALLSSQHTGTGSSAPRDPWRASCYCGESTSEAKTMGCKYDALSAAWLPAHCRDDELTAEFLAHKDGPWHYWADQSHTKELTLDEVGELGKRIPPPLLHPRGPRPDVVHVGIQTSLKVPLILTYREANDPGALFHSTGWEHRTHCLFYWRKEHNCTARGGEWIGDHVQHCIEIIDIEGGYGSVSDVVLDAYVPNVGRKRSVCVNGIP